MSEEPEQEPSIEEILASIRQIISDDDEEAVEATPEPEPEPAPEPEPEPEPAPEPEPEPAIDPDEVLDLTDKIDDEPEEEPEEELVEVDLLDSEEEPEPAADDDDGLFTDRAAGATMEGFASLLGNLAVDRGGHPGGITLEDIVRELMKPMLRDWLDQNLPPLIERLVKQELERLAAEVMKK